MYLRHFAFTRLPFETPAETDELFQSNARREAEARLGHLIELRGIGMLTGEVGSGKTTVCRHLADQLHPGLYRVHYVSLTGQGADRIRFSSALLPPYARRSKSLEVLIPVLYLTVPCDPRDASPTRRRSPWSSNSPKRHRTLGAASTDTTCCPS